MTVTKNFVNVVRSMLTASGYSEVVQGVFDKPGAKFDYQVRLSVAGQALVRATFVFGFRIKEIDQKICNSDYIAAQNAATGKHVPTIMGYIDTIAAWAGIKSARSFDVDSTSISQIDEISNAISAIEGRFITLDDIADLGAQELNLPGGHNSLRVPLLLRLTGRYRDREQYIARMREVNPSPDYESILHQVESS
ncbi:hypothetical protein [Sphingomonas sp. 1P08PE]|uniref:hypothetical protein n=1 Tax=Sphingomonas sp. 1P08PE TaxID=554122 RepID=UPI00399FDEFE